MYNSVFNLDFGWSIWWHQVIKRGTENQRFSVPLLNVGRNLSSPPYRFRSPCACGCGPRFVQPWCTSMSVCAVVSRQVHKAVTIQTFMTSTCVASGSVAVLCTALSICTGSQWHCSSDSMLDWNLSSNNMFYTHTQELFSSHEFVGDVNKARTLRAKANSPRPRPSHNAKDYDKK